MKIKAFVLCFLVPGFAFAQVDSIQSRIKYYNSFVSGVMIGSSSGEKEFTVSFSTVHGIKFKSGVKIGLGVGLDTYYDLKVFPMVASFTLDQERKRQGMFVQVNSGYSVVRSTADIEFGEPYDKGGFTFNPMIGYRMIIENFRIYWQAGYKFQVAEIGYTYTDWTGLPQRFSRHYELNRFVIQLGFGLR